MTKSEAANKRFPSGTTAVHDLTPERERGDITGPAGSSGCGRTTTLRMTDRTIGPTAGALHAGAKDVLTQNAAELRRSVGHVIEPPETVGLPFGTVDPVVRTRLQDELLRPRQELSTTATQHGPTRTKKGS